MSIETFKHNGYTINISQDEEASDPREDDNVCVMVCFHKRYRLGDKDHGYKSDDFSGWDEVKAQIVKDHSPVVILPLSLIDHSGISMYIGSGAHACDPGGWDSGQVGFAFVTRDKALYEFGKKIVTPKVREMAEKCLRAEVETYDQYLRGDVYCYVVKDGDGETIDSCCGFYGIESAREEAKAQVPTEAAPVGGEGQDKAFEETLA